MNEITFTDFWKTFLPRVAPHLIERGAFGRINNVNLLISISRVCKDWQAWVYNIEDGPFCVLQDKIKHLREHRGKEGVIFRLNREFESQGKFWFDFVSSWKPGKTPDSLRSRLADINQVDLSGIPPLIYAIDKVGVDLNNLPLIDLLISYGADPTQHHTIYYQSHGTIKINAVLHLFTNYFRGHKEEIEKLLTSLSKSAKINFPSIYKLFYDNRAHNFDNTYVLLKWLVSHGVNLNILFEDGRNYLHHALNKKYFNKPYIDSDLALEFMDYIDVKICVSHTGEYPLHLFMRNNNEAYKSGDVLLPLLEKAPEVLYLKDKSGKIPLWWAIQKGTLRHLNDLVTQYFKPNLIDTHTKCSLFNAYLDYIQQSTVGQWRIKDSREDGYADLPESWLQDKQLIENAGQFFHTLCDLLAPDKDQKFELLTIDDSDGNTFYHRLALLWPHLFDWIAKNNPLPTSVIHQKNRRHETIKILKEKSLNTIKLIKATSRADLHQVKGLIKKNINIHVIDNNNSNLLHLVLYRFPKINYNLRKHMYEIFELLADHINPNIMDVNQQTPLHVAIRNLDSYSDLKRDWIPFTLILLNHGASIRIKNLRESKILAKICQGACPLEKE